MLGKGVGSRKCPCCLSLLGQATIPEASGWEMSIISNEGLVVLAKPTCMTSFQSLGTDNSSHFSNSNISFEGMA